MIKKIRIKGFRKFKDFTFEPNKGLNVIVGANNAGKSTLLQAINMVLTGRLSNGRKVTENLDPFWFNQQIVEEFFYKLNTEDSRPALPEFRIELYLDVEEGTLQKWRGFHNLSYKLEKDDSPGLAIHAFPDPEYEDELWEYLTSENCPPIVPVEYYRCRWVDFSDATVFRKPEELGVAFIDSSTTRTNRWFDHYTRKILERAVDKRVQAQLKADARHHQFNATRDLLGEVNNCIDDEFEQFDLQLALSYNTAWISSLVPTIAKIPMDLAGQGEQIAAKTTIAMKETSDTSTCVLVEEPENHLSYTRLRQLIAQLETLSKNRQTFISTHSSFVLNRLGLDQLILLNAGKASKFKDLNVKNNTKRFFQKLPGFDTLRIILSDWTVLVEGASDEIVFTRFFKDKFDQEPLDVGLDVVSIKGVSFERGFELSQLLNKDICAIRDNDGKHPNHWKKKLKKYLEEGTREIFIGDPESGETLEPQICNANNPELLRKVLCLKPDEDIEAWMKKNKTEAAMRIAESDSCLEPPEYIEQAINFCASQIGINK